MPYKDPKKRKAYSQSPQNKAYHREYYLKNREKLIAAQIERNKRLEEDPEWRKKRNKKNREWYHKNKEKRGKQIQEWKNKQRDNNPAFRMQLSISAALRTSLKRKGYTKKSRTHEVLGCSYDFFVSHIETQFKEGMNWENYGEWELDHIVPVSLGKTEEEIISLNNYINFQPLWRKDNINKTNKIVWEIIPEENREKYKNIIERKNESMY